MARDVKARGRVRIFSRGKIGFVRHATIANMPSPLRTIFFDVGNTLLFANHAVILQPLRERGIEPGTELLDAVLRRCKNEFDEQLRPGHKPDHSFWWMYYELLLKELELKDAGVHERLVQAARNSQNWDQPREGTRERLQELGQRYRMAVISNADGTVRELLGRCGIADCFESVTDSGMVGCEKPDAAIFQMALESMSARAEESLYVGDVYSVDYAGATGAGMQAVLLDVAGAYREKGVPRVESLEELAERLNRTAW